MSLEGNRVFKVLLLCPNKVNIAFYITFFAITSKMIQLIGEWRRGRGRGEGEREREREREKENKNNRKKEKKRT